MIFKPVVRDASVDTKVLIVDLGARGVREPQAMTLFDIRVVDTASITLCCLLHLQHKFWLKAVGFVAAEILTCQMYQLFFPCISWDKYHHTPILVMVILSS